MGMAPGIRTCYSTGFVRRDEDGRTVVRPVAAVFFILQGADVTMKRLSVLAVAALMIAAVAFVSVTYAMSNDEMVKGAAALDQAFLKAFNAGDANAVAACYASDAVLFPPDQLMVKGQPAVLSGFAQMVKMMPGCTLDLTESHTMVAGDKVISYGTFKMTETGPDGKPMEMMGRYTDVKAMQNGKWVYLVDHASVPMPAPEPEEGE